MPLKIIGCKISPAVYDKINSLNMTKSQFLRFSIDLGLKKIKRNPWLNDTGDLDDFDLEALKEDTLKLLEELENLNLESDLKELE